MEPPCIHTTHFNRTYVTFISYNPHRFKLNIRNSLDVSLVPDPKITSSASSLAFYRSIAATTYCLHCSLFFAFLTPKLQVPISSDLLLFCLPIFVWISLISMELFIVLLINNLFAHFQVFNNFMFVIEFFQMFYYLFRVSYSSKTTSKSSFL